MDSGFIQSVTGDSELVTLLFQLERVTADTDLIFKIPRSLLVAVGSNCEPSPSEYEPDLVAYADSIPINIEPVDSDTWQVRLDAGTKTLELAQGCVL